MSRWPPNRIILLYLMLWLGLTAASDQKGYKTGDIAADFTLKNVTGKMVSSADYASGKGLIVVFTCNHCPFAKKYQQRLNQLNEMYSKKGYPLIAISSTDAIAIAGDSYENMQQRAREEHYNFPYLYDETQAVARAFGAAKTPHAYLLQRQAGHWILRYNGAIDDNGAEPEKVKARYLADAINALLQNKPVPLAETLSIGCAIKWKQ